MLRLAVIAAVALVLGAASATVAEGRTAPPRVAPAGAVASPVPVLAAFRSRLGFSSRTRYGYGYGYSRRSPSLLHRVAKTAIWLYVLHLFFSHGGLSIILWVVIIGLGFSLLRRRRRRYPDRPRSFWS
jgi:hypothetical protein